jgi:hypothetical protein
LQIDSGVTVNVTSNFVVVYSRLDNYGTINIFPPNEGLGNAGTINNYGTINVGGFFEIFSGRVVNDGTINNNGVINVAGSLIDLSLNGVGTVKNCGAIINAANIENGGIVTCPGE